MKINLEQVRKKRGWTQGQLSIYTGISRSYISEIESGLYYPSAVTICRLCQALGCTPNDLIDCDGGED